MKWITKIVLVGALVCGFLGLCSSVAWAATPADACFNFDTATGTIVQYYAFENNDTNQPACPTAVDIPTRIQNVPVEILGLGSFMEHSLTSVTIPSGVTAIEVSAFSRNGLTSVTIPASVVSIDNFAFSDNQLTSVTLLEGLQQIGFNAFSGNLLHDITVPTTVEQIAVGSPASNGMFAGTSVFGAQGPGVAQFWENIRVRRGQSTQISQAPDVEQALQQIWYLRVHLADPANPKNFVDNLNLAQYFDADWSVLPGQGYILAAT